MNTPHTADAAIKAIIFDWGGVLEPMPDAASFAQWEGQLGLAPGRLIDILWGPVWEQLEVAAITRQEYEAHVCARCGFTDPTDLRAFYQSFYRQQIQPVMLQLVRSLRPRYQLALLTNAFAGQREHIIRLAGAAPEALFDAYINSADVQMRKPSPAIFHHTLDQLGVSASQAVFIDDLPRNIAAADTLGIPTILHRDPQATLLALSALLGHPVGGDAPVE